MFKMIGERKELFDNHKAKYQDTMKEMLSLLPSKYQGILTGVENQNEEEVKEYAKYFLKDNFEFDNRIKDKMSDFIIFDKVNNNCYCFDEKEVTVKNNNSGKLSICLNEFILQRSYLINPYIIHKMNDEIYFIDLNNINNIEVKSNLNNLDRLNIDYMLYKSMIKTDLAKLNIKSDDVIFTTTNSENGSGNTMIIFHLDSVPKISFDRFIEALNSNIENQTWNYLYEK